MLPEIIEEEKPIVTAPEVVRIDPESLEVANCYLENPDIRKVSKILDIDTDIVSTILAKREVKAYIDSTFKDVGYNSRIRMRELMDAVITKKLQDMQEDDIGSDKDILDIISMSHKMSMEHLDKEIKLAQIKAEEKAAEKVKSQVNVQINNDVTSGSNYEVLLEKLLGKTNVNDKP